MDVLSMLPHLRKRQSYVLSLNVLSDSEDEVEQNTTTFIVDKNRPFAKLGRAGSVYYDPSTTILREELFHRGSTGSIMIFDVEADGLLDDATKIHCMSFMIGGMMLQTTCDYDTMRKYFA